MQLPFFFEETLPLADELTLSEESSRHITQVLRMPLSGQLLITNGKGDLLQASIILADKRKTVVKITGRTFHPGPFSKISVAISLIKNKTRFEWFLEKAAEIGVAEIIPLICHRTEKQHFKEDRLKNILVSAMLQSQQAWLPLLHPPVKFEEIIKLQQQQKFIAHCVEGQKKPLLHEMAINRAQQKRDRLILIGPEGDFTKEEIDLALLHNFSPVSLGETRLRTETAGLVAAVLLLNT